MIDNKYTNIKIEKNTYLKIKELSKKEGVSMVVLFAAIANFFTKNNVSVFEDLTLNFTEIEKINNLKFDRVMKKLSSIEVNYLRPMALRSEAINEVVFDNSQDEILKNDTSAALNARDLSLTNKEKLRDFLFSEWLNVSSYIKRPNINDKSKNDLQRIYSEDQMDEYIKRVNEFLS